MESERRYRNFDWGRCMEWQSYLSNIYPSPTLEQVQRIRRRWYQRNIDPSIQLDPPRPASSSVPPTHVPRPPPVPPTHTTSQQALTVLELGLFVLVGIPAGIEEKTLHILAAGFFADIVRKQGSPTLAVEYWARAARESELMSIVFCVLFLSFGMRIVPVLPVYMCAAALTIQICSNSPVLPQALKTTGQRLERWKPHISTWQYRLELLLIPALLLLFTFNLSGFLLIPLYIYLLAVRQAVKPESGEGIRELKACGDALCIRWPRLEPLWRRAMELCSKLGCTLSLFRS